jgi:uridine monophosphate synthetase
MEQLILELYTKNCIKFGDFTLKNGTKSTIYIDLKNIISHPYLTNTITNILYNKIKCLKFDRICGVPYGAIPIASLIAFNHNIPLLLIRKETKTYGLKKLIEGEYNAGDEIILVEDTITTGSSILKFIEILNRCKIKVLKIVVICDRREDPTALLDGYKIDTIITFKEIQTFLKKHIFIERLNQYPTNSIKSVELIKCMETKLTNICLTLTQANFIGIDRYLDKICILKINNINYQPKTIQQLIELSKKFNFKLLEATCYNQIHTQQQFFDLFTKNHQLYKWIDFIIIQDTSLTNLLPIFSKIKTHIGILIKYTDMDINVIKLIIEKYRTCIVGILDYNDDEKLGVINFSKQMIAI